MSTQTFYITGTDTDAGKTWASVAIIETIKQHTEKKILGMKPVASGCHATENGLRNDDALKLKAAANVMIDYNIINPYALLDATAPEIAAAKQNVTLDLSTLLAAHQHCSQHADIIIVEGVGGWLAPLSSTLEQADLVRALHCPVLLVVGLKLGCINHARLTQQALLNQNILCAGWIAAEVDPNMLFAGDYFQALARVMTLPFLGRVNASAAHQLEDVLSLIR